MLSSLSWIRRAQSLALFELRNWGVVDERSSTVYRALEILRGFEGLCGAFVSFSMSCEWSENSVLEGCMCGRRVG